jgi:integrase
MPRCKGSVNRGYFYRAGRGWSATIHGSKLQLTDAGGSPLRDRKIPKKVLEEASRRLRDAHAKKILGKDGITVSKLSVAFLAHVRQTRREGTHDIRSDYLFDFGSGFPATLKESKEKPPAHRRIHTGYGEVVAAELTAGHVDDWLASHKGWTNGSQAMACESVIAMLNYGRSRGYLSANPICGYKYAKCRSRKTYFTDEQEQGIYRRSSDEWGKAVKVMIRTGARPGEFAQLTAKHVTFEDGDKRMMWKYAANEIKNKVDRAIFCCDPEIIAIVKAEMERHPVGPVFRNTNGKPWTSDTMRSTMLRTKARLKKKDGIELDTDACTYSCRHTFAKRILCGYWRNGQPTTIEHLAKLMGNTPAQCRKYADWVPAYQQPLWDAVGNE